MVSIGSRYNIVLERRVFAKIVGTGVLDGPRDVKQNKPLRIVFALPKAPSARDGAMEWIAKHQDEEFPE